MSEGVVTQFVWFYVPGPKDGWELRHSIRSVRKYFQGAADIVVIGDHPGPWFDGTLIEVARVGRERGIFQQPFWDTRNKWKIAATCPVIRDEFVWMMDDQFFINPVTAERLQEPKADPFYRRPATRYGAQTKYWNRLVIDTFDWLERRHYKACQFATHAPHWIAKSRLLEVMNSLPKDQILLPEIVYGSTMCDPPGSCFPFLQRIQSPMTDRKLEEIGSKATVVNLAPEGFTAQAKNWIGNRLA